MTTNTLNHSREQALISLLENPCALNTIEERVAAWVELLTLQTEQETKC